MFIRSQWLVGGTCAALGLLSMQACELPSLTFTDEPLQHCENGRRDAGETGVDCGDPCGPCCPEGFGECDGDLGAVCETNVRTSQEHCGACDAGCRPPHASGSCVGGACRLLDCEPPYADCNRLPEDGCEVNLKSNADNCGSCERACPALNGVPACVEGTCQIECGEGFRNCNAESAEGWQDGCEKSVLSDVSHCGSCSNRCVGKAGETAFCSAGVCGSTLCAGGRGDCNGDADDGCEVELGTETRHCGVCGNDCEVAFPNAEATCVAGKCVIASCKTGYDNCNTTAADGGVSDGCETNISTSAQNCGGCGGSGMDCTNLFPNASGRCLDGACVIERCAAQFSDCDELALSGCESDLLTDVDDCGVCGKVCQVTHASAVTCVAGTCRPSCSAGWGACGDAAAGCATPLDTAKDCGSCGKSCAGATPFCVSGACSDRLKIELMNASTVGAAFNVLNMPHPLQSSGGQRRLVLLSLASSGALETAESAKPEVVTYGVSPSTPRPNMRLFGTLPFGGSTTYTSFYYMLDADLPANPGSQNLVIDARPNTPNGGSTQLLANVLEFRGVDQTNPIEELFKESAPNCGPNIPTHAVVVANTGSFIYSLAAFEWGEVSTIVGGLVSTLNARIESGSALNARGGYRGPLNTGTYTVGWPRASCVRHTHQVIALRPATTP